MAVETKRDQPVRLPNPSAQPFVSALKTVRFFAVVFFWVVFAAVVAHVTAFVLTEWVAMYDAASAAPPAGAADRGASRAAGAPGFLEGRALAAEPDTPPAKAPTFFGIPAGSGAAAQPKEETPAEAAPPAPTPPAPEAGSTGKAVAEGETPPPPRAPVTPEQRARTAEHYRVHTAALLRTLRVLGILFSVLLWITLFIYLQIALLGRLSGIRQLTNAVFIVLLFLATAVPWETVFPEVHIGAFYDFEDLLTTHAGRLQGVEVGVWGHWAGYYLKFCAMPLLSLVLLVLGYANFSSGYHDSVVVNE